MIRQEMDAELTEAGLQKSFIIKHLLSTKPCPHLSTSPVKEEGGQKPQCPFWQEKGIPKHATSCDHDEISKSGASFEGRDGP